MAFENTYTNIFTEFDESIFSDGSIDPMGLRIIWTALGNNIFKNKLNTISTDIRLYTLNLFHHNIIQSYQDKFRNKIINLTGKSPYSNTVDLYNGIIIFLEFILAHAARNINEKYGTSISVPGVSKLSNIMAENPNDARAQFLLVNSEKGILIRHILLGIHGRHKGPFRQMQIFSAADYYSNRAQWQEAGKLFSDKPWKELHQQLTDIIAKYIFENNRKKEGYIYAPADEVLNDDLVTKYANVLKNETFKDEALIEYWEKQLGLREGAANLLFEELVKARDKEQYEIIIRAASEKGMPEDNRYIKAICSIESFISRMEKVSQRLLNRGTTSIDDTLEAFLLNSLKDDNIDLSEIKTYLTEEFLSHEALRRTTELYHIYLTCKQKNDAACLVQQLIDYHKKIMGSRGNLPWLSFGSRDNITQHRSFVFSDNYLASLADNRWVNDYYLSTVLSLYNGLHQQ